MITKRILNRAIHKAGNQSRLAVVLGFSRQMMSKIKTGKLPFPEARAQQLMEYLERRIK